MALARPPQQYEQDDQANTRQAIDISLADKQSKQEDVYFIGNRRLILADSVTGALGVITVTAGVLSWIAI